MASRAPPGFKRNQRGSPAPLQCHASVRRIVWRQIPLGPFQGIDQLICQRCGASNPNICVTSIHALIYKASYRSIKSSTYTLS